jgi:hypothetical protein
MAGFEERMRSFGMFREWPEVIGVRVSLDRIAYKREPV